MARMTLHMGIVTSATSHQKIAHEHAVGNACSEIPSAWIMVLLQDPAAILFEDKLLQTKPCRRVHHH